MTTQAPEHFADRFWVLWGSQAASLLGSFAVQFAIIWWLTINTGSPTVLALATFVGIVPQVVLGPVIGALVDRWDRKLIMLCADSAIAIASAWLAWLFFIDAATTLHVFLVLGVRAVGAAFHGPAMLASTSLMVPEQHYTRIQGLNQAVTNGSPLLAAPVGALLVSWLPMHSILLVDVVTALIAVIPLLFVRVPQPDAEDPETTVSSVVADIAEGMRYLLRHRGTMYLVMGATFVNLCIVPAFALLPLFVLEELTGGAWLLSLLQLLFGFGGVVGGSVLAAWGGFRRRVHTVILGFAAMGIATLLIGVAPATHAWLPAAGMLAVGGAAALINGSIMALLQSQVAADYQGRLFALLASLAGAMIPVALLLAAPLAEWFGIRFWYVAGGVSCCIVAGLALAIPAVANIDDPLPDPDV